MPRKYSSQINRFGAVIFELRSNAELTQKQLAKLCSINEKTVRRVEKGEIAIGLETLLSFAKVFKLQPSELLEKVKLKIE